MMPKPPKPQPTQRMPSPDDPDIANAARVKMQEDELKKRGRASTNLTGGQAYTRTTLG